MGGWVARPARRSSHGRTRRIGPVDRARRGSILAVNGRGPPTWESVRRHHRPSRPPQIASSAQLCSSNRTRARDSPPLSSSCSRRSAGLAHPPPPCSPPQHPRPAAAPPRAPSPNPSLAISPHCPGATTCPALPCAWPAAPTAAIVLRRRPSPDALECAGKVPFLCAEFRLVAEVQVAAGIFKSPA